MKKINIDDTTAKILKAIEDDVLSKFISTSDYTPIAKYVSKHYREALGLPFDLDVGAFSVDSKFPIPYIVKVRLVRYMVSRLRPDNCKGSFMAVVLRISNNSFDRLYGSVASNVAVAIDDHFVQKTIDLDTLRKRLAVQFKISVAELLSYPCNSPIQISKKAASVKTMHNCLVNRCPTTVSELLTIFSDDVGLSNEINISAMDFIADFHNNHFQYK